MARLDADYTPRFLRDYKKLKKIHANMSSLHKVIDLVLENTAETIDELRRHHNMHTLSGKWQGSFECHVCNADNWLLVWYVAGDLAVFQRTGTHDELFR